MKHEEHTSLQPTPPLTCCSSAQHLQFSVAEAETKQPETQADWLTSDWFIPELDCPTEEGMIRQKLQFLPDVQLVSCNMLSNQARISYASHAQADVTQALTDLGFHPQLLTADEPAPAQPLSDRKRWLFLGTSGFLALAAELLHSFSAADLWVLLCTLASITLCGTETFKNGLLAVKNRNLNINALMSVAVIGAIAIKQWPEAAMVMFLFTIAEMLEAYSLVRARQTIKGLLDLAPEMVTVQVADQWQEQPVAQVALGAMVRVKPGERIGLDGVVSEGFSSVNQAPITGESVPVEKQIDDPVFAGTINESGSFIYRVTATAKNTTLAHIIEAVENAQSARAPIQTFIEKFSRYYIPAVFILALIIAFIVPIFMGDWLGWFYKSLILLVISCPCALVISTPVTIVSGLSLAAKRGILIKGGVFLETARNMKWLALDKTGTLTHGKPEQTDMVVFVGDASAVRHLTASLAARSDHPVSGAITRAASEMTLAEVDQFTALAGFGTQGIIDGTTYYLVNERFFARQNRPLPEAVIQTLQRLQAAGNTVVLFADEQQILACFAVADTIKENVAATIAELHRMQVKTLMITGDHRIVAQTVAQAIGIDEVYAEQLPQNKLEIIQQKHQQDGVIAMVGDGINDAPALAQADIGIAMGQLGADTAVETADVVLMDDQLDKIVEYIRISKQTYRILLQNISFALGIKLVFILLTLLGLSSMWMAVFADVGMTLLVVLNGLRILWGAEKTVGN